MKIALAQINTTVGDFDGNRALIRGAMERAVGARLLVCPELSLCGYPPLDLLERRDFRDANRTHLEALAAETGALRVLVGFVDAAETAGTGLRNAAALLGDGRILAVRRKVLLPTYDVFDERRYFDPDPRPCAPVEIDGVKIGVTLCEDIWNDPDFWPAPRYDRDPVAELAAAGADAIVNLSASPYHLGKPELRGRLLTAQARRYGLPVAYCNLVGGNDELIFEGGSILVDAAGGPVAHLPRFQEGVLTCDLFAPGAATPPAPDDASDVRAALVLGLQDYCRKCGFSHVVVGLSGGIDSAVTAALAVEALGAGHVTGVAMPSRYSSEGSVTDARALAEALDIRFHVLPIEGPFQAVLEALSPAFGATPGGVAEENVQARLRGLYLMTFANAARALVLTTGNKSELAVGYCTLYGDMSGGLAVISDLPKQWVYAVARELNASAPVIPEATFTKPPSAELRPDQTDQDSLPPYEVLDDVLRRYVEEGALPEEIAAAGHPRALVDRLIGLVDRNEYKRRQAAPGLRVTSKAFGLGRRVPIAQRYRHER